MGNGALKAYKKKDFIGQGAYGKVFKLEHKKTKVRYAVKIIKKKKLSKSGRILIRKEIEILQQTDHDNCCHLIDVIQTPKRFYLIQELLEGETLYDRFANESCHELTEWHIARCVRQIASALQYLHKKEIIHRDLKPRNIMFVKPFKECTDMTLKILDFGFATHLEHGYTTSSRGTPAYIAPEVLWVDKEAGIVCYGTSCDLWSLGVILYELIAGRSPFNIASVRRPSDLPRFYRHVLKDNIEYALIEWRNVSPEAKHLTSKLLEKEAKKRITAQEVLEHPWLLRNNDDYEEIIAPLSMKELQTLHMVTTTRATRVKKMVIRGKLLKVVSYLRLMARLRMAMGVLLGSIDLSLDKDLWTFCRESMTEIKQRGGSSEVFSDLEMEEKGDSSEQQGPANRNRMTRFRQIQKKGNNRRQSYSPTRGY